MASKRVLKCLSIEDKFKLIKEIESGSKKKDVAVKYCIPASTVSTILKNKDSIITSFVSGISTGGSKRMKKPIFENVDKAILYWFIAARNQNIPISGRILKEKALEFAKRFGSDNFKASTGWLDKWKQRHSVCRNKICGEINAIRGEDCNNWTTGVLPHLLEKYNKRDIFNADETGLFYKCLPDKTLTFKNEQCHGGKHSKDRVTLMLAANMDGSEKLKILLIGRSSKPRCFRGIRWLPVEYKANSKAWMTAQLFEEWIVKLDKQFLREGRKILLFIDNCSSHTKNLQNELKSIELAFFPPNITSKLQPLEQGVIQNLKCRYRSRILEEAIKRIETKTEHTITLMDCIIHVAKAWDMDVSNQTIANCFKKAGFGQNSESEEEDDIPLIFLNSIDEDQKLMQANYETWLRLNNISSSATLKDYIEVDNQICTSGFLTDDDIIEHYSSEPLNPASTAVENDDEGLVEECIQQPSKNDIVDSLRYLNLYLQTNDNTTDDHYKALNKLEALFIESNRKK